MQIKKAIFNIIFGAISAAIILGLIADRYALKDRMDEIEAWVREMEDNQIVLIKRMLVEDLNIDQRTIPEDSTEEIAFWQAIADSLDADSTEEGEKLRQRWRGANVKEWALNEDSTTKETKENHITQEDFRGHPDWKEDSIRWAKEEEEIRAFLIVKTATESNIDSITIEEGDTIVWRSK